MAIKAFIRIVVVILIALSAIIAFWPLELDKEQAFLVMVFAFSLAATVIWLSLYLGFGIKINKVLAELLYILIIPLILITRFIWGKARTLWHKKPEPKKRDPWYLGSIFDVLKLRLKPLEVVLGTHWGEPIRIRLDKYHTLIGGSTDQGKTVLLNSFIAQLVLTEQPVDIWIFDLKGAKQDTMYLWSPVVAKYVSDTEPAIEALTELIKLMEVRTKNGWGREMVVIIDELASFTSIMLPEYRRHTINLVATLARLCRSGGIRLIAATQYPRYDDAPKIITHNMLRKICLGVTGNRQAGVILEMAEKIPVSLPQEQGDFILREGKKFKQGRTILVTREDIVEIVNRVMANDDDERLRILRRVTTGLQPGDRIRGLNATAESLSMDSEILKIIYRNFALAGAFRLGGESPQAGYRLAVESAEGMGLVKRWIAGSCWDDRAPSLWNNRRKE